MDTVLCGKGTFGVVVRLGRGGTVVKTPSMHDPHAARLWSEACILHDLCVRGCPNIVQYIDWSPSGRLYMVEYPITLQQYLVREQVTPKMMSLWIEQLLQVLGFMRAMQLVHCDLKVDNILLDEWCNIKVGDFGNAQYTWSIPLLTHDLRNEVALVGRSPEVLWYGHLSFATDVFSLGAVVSECYDVPFVPMDVQTNDDLRRFYSFDEKRCARVWLPCANCLVPSSCNSVAQRIKSHMTNMRAANVPVEHRSLVAICLYPCPRIRDLYFCGRKWQRSVPPPDGADAGSSLFTAKHWLNNKKKN